MSKSDPTGLAENITVNGNPPEPGNPAAAITNGASQAFRGLQGLIARAMNGSQSAQNLIRSGAYSQADLMSAASELGNGLASTYASGGVASAIQVSFNLGGYTFVTAQDLGNDAHAALLGYALGQGPQWFGNTSTAPDGTQFGSGPFGLSSGRPDLGNSNILQLWELKPAGYEFGALSQVWDYSLSTAPLFGSPKYRPAQNAPSFFSGNSLNLPGAFGSIEYQFRGYGVLTYTYGTNNSVVRVPNALALPSLAPDEVPVVP